MDKLKKLDAAAVQLMYPRRCPVCDEIVTPRGELICPDCLGTFKIITGIRCLKCGKKLERNTALCRDCTKHQHVYDRGRALYEFDSVAESIYAFKYGGRAEYGEFFGREMAFYLEEFLDNIRPDALIPVPLSRKRLIRRGFNQAEILAKYMGEAAGIPVITDLIGRSEDTRALKEMNPLERENNLKSAFIIKRNDVKLKSALIVDDIYTTGSTIDAVTEALRSSGIKEVCFSTLAIGSGI